MKNKYKHNPQQSCDESWSCTKCHCPVDVDGDWGKCSVPDKPELNDVEKWRDNCKRLNPYSDKGFVLTKDEVVTMYTALKMLHDYGGDWIDEPQDLEFLEKVGLVIKKIEDIWQKTRLN